MGWKILDENDEIVYEFDENVPAAHWLSVVFLKSKFGEAFDPLMVTVSKNQWQYELLKAFTERLETKWPTKGQSTNSMGYTKDDDTWEHLYLDTQEFFIGQAHKLGWAISDFEQREEMIRCAIYPHPISERRLKDLIEDIDHRLKTYSNAYNPKYSHDT